jgi:hypothetical protein
MGEKRALRTEIVKEMWDEPVLRITECLGVPDPIHHHDEYMTGLVSVHGWRRWECGRYWRSRDLRCVSDKQKGKENNKG